MSTLSAQQLEELFRRSAAGEGVRAVLAEFGYDDDATLEGLKQHTARLRECKTEYRQSLVERHAKIEREAKKHKISIDDLEGDI